jgi:hypothetical protein
MDFILFAVILALFIYHKSKVSEYKKALTESKGRERNAISRTSEIKLKRAAFMDANSVCNPLLFDRLLQIENLLGKIQRKPLLYLYIKLHKESDKAEIAKAVCARWKDTFMLFEDSTLRVAVPSRSHEADNPFAFKRTRKELQDLLLAENISCSIGVGSTLGAAFDDYSSSGNLNLCEKDTVFVDGDRTTA